MQDAAFSSAFLPGIPGGQVGRGQNRWMLPVQSQGLHYPPRLLAVMLLIAHHRFLSPDDRGGRTADRHGPGNSRVTSTILSAAEPGLHRCIRGKKAENLEGRSLQAGMQATMRRSMRSTMRSSTRRTLRRTATRTAQGDLEVSSTLAAANRNKNHFLPSQIAGVRRRGGRDAWSLDGLEHRAARAVCEGLEKTWWKPGHQTSEKKAIEVAEVQVPGELEAVPSTDSGVTDSEGETDIGAAKQPSVCHSTSVSGVNHSEILESLQAGMGVQPAPAQSGDVLAAFLRARERIIDEMQNLRDVKKITAPPPDKFLSGMLRAFAPDLLCSKHACSEACGILDNHTDAQAPYAPFQEDHNGDMEDQGTSSMRFWVARGIMHAMEYQEVYPSKDGSLQQQEELEIVGQTLSEHTESTSITESSSSEHQSQSISIQLTRGYRSTFKLLPHMVAWHLVRLMLNLNSMRCANIFGYQMTPQCSLRINI